MKEQQRRSQIVIQTLKKLYPETGTFLNASSDYEFLFAVILSAQTTDKQVNKETPGLFSKYPTLRDYVQANPMEFESDLRHIGLYKSKAKNILASAKLLFEKYNGKVPDTMQELLELPGVGRKTANVVMTHIHGKSEGIAVDTHVKRLAQKYGLTLETDPTKIEQDLLKIIPPQEWSEFTHRMILYGREYCPAKTHAHEKCPLTLSLQKYE